MSKSTAPARRVFTEAQAPAGVDSSPYDGAGVGVAIADGVRVREGPVEFRGRGESGGVAVNGAQVAVAVCPGPEGLTDEPRPERPRKITDEQVERVITATLEHKPPQNDTHWSPRSMATATGMSQPAISRI
jgi:Homeodomain-like domain